MSNNDNRNELTILKQHTLSIFKELIVTGHGEETIRTALRAVLANHWFEEWARTTREQREAVGPNSLPPNVLDAFRGVDFQVELVKELITFAASISLNVKGFNGLVDALRQSGIPIYNKPTENRTYNIGLQGDFGWVPLLAGKVVTRPFPPADQS